MSIIPRLFTPGPTEIPPEIRAVLNEPMIHHRTQAFKALFAGTQEALGKVFQTQNTVLMLAASGTGAMEASVSNFFSSKDHVLVINAGKFGQRWADLAKTFGLKVTVLRYEPGVPARVEDVTDALKANPDICGVFMTASETSTATWHPVDQIARAVRAVSSAITVVDAVTAIGIHDVKTDDWGLDLVVAGSQKGFMLPPGLAFVSVSERAWRRAETSNIPKYYWDLRKARTGALDQNTPYTPAISLIRGCHMACEMMLKDGLHKWCERHRRMMTAVHAGAEAMGLELIAKKSPSWCLTAMRIPPEIGAGAVKKVLADDFHMIVAAGQDELKDKIVRIAHFGALNMTDVGAVMSALELTLRRLGAAVELGAAERAIEACMHSADRA